MLAPAPLPPLHGRRVALRAFTEADITPAYLGWLADPEVVRYSNQRFVRHSAESCRRYLEGFAGSANVFASVRLRDTDQAIGTLTAYRSMHHGSADVGILMGERSVWGQGLGLDAFATLCDWLALQPGMRKLTAGTLACNQGMVRVAERAGMQLEAVRREQELVDGQPTDILYFARFVGRS
jgi:ribosomal-protein-alanine N-acetyltransferase